MTTATRTIKTINTKPGTPLPTGTCKFCYAHRVRLTHNVKYPNGNLLRVCLRCATDSF